MAEHDMGSADLLDAARDAADDELDKAMQDVAGDMGEEAAEAGFYDLVIGVAHNLPSKSLRFDFCRRHLGMVPQQVADWG